MPRAQCSLCLIAVLASLVLLVDSFSSTALLFRTSTRQTTSRLFLAKKKKKKGFAKDESSDSSTPTLSTTTTTKTPEKQNAGQRALAELRRQRAEQKDEELRRVRELLKEDEQVQESSAAIPERVAQRMGQRMLPFVGIPLFGGMGTFVGFWYMATYKNMEFEPVSVAAATIGVLVVGLLVRAVCVVLDDL